MKNAIKISITILEKELQVVDSDFVLDERGLRGIKEMIERDMTIPQIATELPQFNYEEVYDTIYRDDELNLLYRQHAQLKIKKRRY